MSKSPSAELQVARLPHQAGASPISLAVQLPAVGCLAVRVAFLGEPVCKLKVAFHRCDPDGKKGEKLSKDGLVTSDRGEASMDELVLVGSYWCVIENQPDALITTVDSVKSPLTISLPVGRPRRRVP